MLRVAELASTCVLAGLIWTVQLVHYPALALGDPSRWRQLHGLHTRRISWLVVPLMLAEAASAVLLWVEAPAAEAAARGVGLLLLALVWSSTFALQVPIHRRLEQAFDPAALRRLVETNWVRTGAWSARAVLLGWLMARG